MLIKNYGLYDSVAKNLVNTFVAANDETAIRSCESICKDPKSDVRLLKDCIVQYLYTLDSESAQIVDVSKRDLVTMSSLIEKSGIDLSQASYAELVARFESIENKFGSFEKLDSKCQSIIDNFAKSLEIINSKLNDIIGGKIKCQKFKKNRN